MGLEFWAECGYDCDELEDDYVYCDTCQSYMCDCYSEEPQLRQKTDPVVEGSAAAAVKAAEEAEAKINRKRYKTEENYKAACRRKWHDAYIAEQMRVNDALVLLIRLGLIDEADIKNI